MRRLSPFECCHRGWPIRHPYDFGARLSGIKIFSKVELVREYHQVPVAPEGNVWFIRIFTDALWFEEFCWNVSVADGKRLPISRLCFCLLWWYSDSKCVTDGTSEHLYRLFKRLSDLGLVVNVNKCQFGRCQIEFLDHLITQQECRPLPSKVNAIQVFLHPLSPKTYKALLT